MGLPECKVAQSRLRILVVRKAGKIDIQRVLEPLRSAVLGDEPFA